MTRWHRRAWAGPDDGSAVVEFVFLAVLLLVPVVYLVVTVARVQAGALAAAQGAREAGRAYVTAADEQSGVRRASAAVALAYRDQGFGPPGPSQLRISCTSTECWQAGARVTVRAELTVPLPGVPRFLTHLIPAAVTMRSTHVATVDEFARR